MPCCMLQGCCEQLVKTATRHQRQNPPRKLRTTGYIQIFKTALNTISRLSDSIIRAINTANIEGPLSTDLVSTHTSPSLTGISYLTCSLTREKKCEYAKCSRIQYAALHLCGMYGMYGMLVLSYKLVKAETCCPDSVLCLHLPLLIWKCH